MMNNETISMPAAGTEEITVQQTVPEAIATEAAQQPEEKAVVEHLRDEVEKHRNGAEPNDDLTILCLKVD